MFKFNIKLLYFFGSNVVINNIFSDESEYDKNFIVIDVDSTIFKSKDKIKIKEKEVDDDSDYTFLYVYNNLDCSCFKNFKENAFNKDGLKIYQLIDLEDKKNKENLKPDDVIDFTKKYKFICTKNYIETSNDSIIKIDNGEYKKKYILFFKDFNARNLKKLDNKSIELELMTYIGEKVLNSCFNIYDYFIKKFKIGDKEIIDDNIGKFENGTLLEINEKSDVFNSYNGKKIEIILNKYKSYKLTGVNIIPDLAKIYKLKDTTVLINNINGKISKSRKELTYDDIQNIITNTLGYDGIVLNDKLTNILPKSFNITIKGDPKNYFTEPRKCTITFISNEFKLEDTYKNSMEIIFDNKVNEGIKVKEYIFNTYKLNDTNCEIKSEAGYNVSDNITFSDGAQYNIIIKNHVAGITKKKEADDVIINIEISSDKPDEFKLKDNVTKNEQIVLKKSSCKIKDLITNLKGNGYNGIEKDGIIAGIFLDKNPTNNILESTEDLKGGEYKILLSGQENNFVEKKIKKPTKKNITLTIVPKDATKYELKGINSNITINVTENISYKDFVDKVKKTIIDCKFEVYIDNNKVENVNIDINKPIIIKLLDDCNKLKEIKEDNGDGNGGGDNGDGKKGDEVGDNNGNESTKSTKKCQCRSSKK